MNERKVILYIAASLDGYIAKPNDDISFLSMVEKEGEDYGYGKFMSTVDTIILGRRTYDKVLSMGYEYPSERKIFVVTRNPKANRGVVSFYSGSLKDLVAKLKSEPGKNIHLDGGAEIVSEMLKLDLIDEFFISMIPIVLGDGIPLFKKGIPEMKLKLEGVESFEKGLVQLHYVRSDT